MRRTHHLESPGKRPLPLPVVIVGLGPIGLEVAKLAAARPELFHVAGAVDRAPQWVGRKLSTVLGRAAAKTRVVADVESLPAVNRGIAFHTIASQMGDVTASVQALVRQGWHVVSSSEELSYPQLRRPLLARKIDRAARRAKRAVVATGINPGFAMDVWPLVLSSNMQDLQRVTVHRIVDASQRREPLQRKIGSGMSAKEFAALARAGRIGHVGLVESAAHLGGALGWKIDTVRETLVPKLATRRIRTAYFTVARGRVAGIHHRAEATAGGTLRIVLDLTMQLGAPKPRDEVHLDGFPALHCIVPGGFHGDRTTVSQLLSAAARIDTMAPGLHLASDLPAPRYAAATRRLTLR
jgi:4-hydroxy-tetrahydrodipicolinate reductase